MASVREILINLLGKETISPAAKKAGDAVEDLGGDLQDTAGHAEKLDERIGELKGSLADLAAQYAATNDDSFVKQIRAQERELRKVTKVRGILEEARKAGEDLGGGMLAGLRKTFSGGISGVFSGMPPQVQGAVVAAGAAIGVTLAGAIGAAATAGVLLAVGGGVLAAGIKAAANSPAVQSAWKSFGDRAKASLKGFGTPFEGPLIRAADTFAAALERMAPTLKSMGESMAPVIDKLAPALASMAEKALPGIKDALESSQPLWDTLAEHLPDIGEAVSKFFESISSGAPGANSALGDILNIIEGTIIALGAVLGALSKLYEGARGVWKGIANVFAEGVRHIINLLGGIVTGAAAAFGWIPGLGPKLKGAAKEFAEFQRKANHEIDKITGKTVHVDVTLRGIKNLEEQVAVRLGRRAAGGPVLAGQAYLVGEKGPEILSMGNASGHIIPNHQLGAAMGGAAGATALSGVIKIRSDGTQIGNLAAALLEILKPEIRIQGGLTSAFGG